MWVGTETNVEFIKKDNIDNAECKLLQIGHMVNYHLNYIHMLLFTLIILSESNYFCFELNNILHPDVQLYAVI